MQLLTRHDHIQVVLWVRACVILQNLLLNYYCDRKWNDVHDFNDSKTNQDEMQSQTKIPSNDEAFGKEKREHLKWIVLRHKGIS